MPITPPKIRNTRVKNTEYLSRNTECMAKKRYIWSKIRNTTDMRRAWSPPGANNPQPASKTTSKSTSLPNYPPKPPTPLKTLHTPAPIPPVIRQPWQSLGGKYIFVDWLQRDVDQIFAKVTDRSLITSKGLILFPNLLRTIHHCFCRSIHSIALNVYLKNLGCIGWYSWYFSFWRIFHSPESPSVLWGKIFSFWLWYNLLVVFYQHLYD